ncbi:aminopeptidase N [Desulfotalea psychrophila]|uniref:Aminopeptidase N n=1 Tax=Desulfotalea psychrophila (strain LSv54 / DSM 12343) TaxID=177439 RepID=Q6AL82_DESPS|nr:aminopeptidase N [Desulfotalea psychrophila]CAG36893.1 probable aminopeptidase N [Desulfotalea psychrophila LSv54]
MQSPEHETIYRKDYTSPAFLVEKTELLFQLFAERAVVTATVSYRQNPDGNPAEGLLLLGEELLLKEVALDGRTLNKNDYEQTDKFLRIADVPENFILRLVTEIYPDKNTSLEGLYRTNGNYCTQCEAEGFRKITYYPDRPCVLAPFTTRIEADKKACPVMLSNGNRIDAGELEGGRHFALWQDPHPKPSYLFALVAGELVAIEESFTTRFGREVALKIFVEERNKTKCDHAMVSLKKAMKWDEDVFGLEYDLDIFMIVAVDDFNMGAMENKGLNVFNSKYVLALPETATDRDYLGIEGVIAHEYFHNWTGNRVTCRDWFQLSLKEGLTVFRDQEFSSDMNSRPVQRIDDVKVLRDHQFKEDAGAMAHPIRPDAYVEINNFYTATVYNKGAEVIRMIHTLLGAEKFRAGMDLYFVRHDGQAVTCDDFVAAMEDASGVDLLLFRNWYSQAGTPCLEVKEEWNNNEETYRLYIRQTCPPTPGQESKAPFHIPVAVGLLGENGQDLLAEGTRVLHLKETEQCFLFEGIKEKPVLSFLRGFSAPVRVKPFQPSAELVFLMAHDSDLFNRWDASQRLTIKTILRVVDQLQRGETLTLKPAFVEAMQANLRAVGDQSLVAQAIRLPEERYLASLMAQVDVENLHRAHDFVRSEIARQCQDDLARVYRENQEETTYSITPAAMGRRAIKNAVLPYLVTMSDWWQTCADQYHSATNMSDAIAALAAMVDTESPLKKELLADFYNKWQADPLVMDKWFAIQAGSTVGDTLTQVKKLMKDPQFSMANPNKVRALIGFFANNNHLCFHDVSGAGYAFLADNIIALHRANPQIAARLSSAFTGWRKYDETHQLRAKEEMQRVLATENLSTDVHEVVSKLL